MVGRGGDGFTLGFLQEAVTQDGGPLAAARAARSLLFHAGSSACTSGLLSRLKPAQASFFRLLTVMVITVKESEVTQSCPTPCNPMDCSLPGPSVPEIL